MSLYKYVERVLIGDGTTTGTSLPSIVKGDLLLLSENGTVITTVAAAAALPKLERVRIAMGIAPGIAILSSPIQGNTVSLYSGKAYTAPSEQVSYVGYNGTSGTGINIDVDTEYRLRIRIKDSHRVHGQKPTLIDLDYPGSATATEQIGAAYIAKLADQKELGYDFISDKIKLERVCNGTFTANAAGATVTKGSKTVAHTGHGYAAGDIIRIGGTTYASPVYVIESVVDANTYKLDVVYKGTSGSVLAANIGKMTVVTEWGFKITGVAQDSKIYRAANEPFDEYSFMTFVASFADSDDRNVESKATVTTTEANPGIGYWKQVAAREEKAKGYWGDTAKLSITDKRINSQVVVDQGYATVIIQHAEILNGDFQDTYRAPLSTEIYIPTGSNQADATAGNNRFLALLNGYFSTVCGFTALSTM
jgi:hypothetical protein